MLVAKAAILAVKTVLCVQGRMSRMLAAKAALSARVDALGEDVHPTIAKPCRQKLEKQISNWMQGKTYTISKKAKQVKQGSYIPEK